MKVESVGFEYEGRVALYLVPETQVERTLLNSLWKHGKMEITNGVCDGSGAGYAITQERAAKAGGGE